MPRGQHHRNVQFDLWLIYVIKNLESGAGRNVHWRTLRWTHQCAWPEAHEKQEKVSLTEIDICKLEATVILRSQPQHPQSFGGED
jgi:hypothetical protein